MPLEQVDQVRYHMFCEIHQNNMLLIYYLSNSTASYPVFGLIIARYQVISGDGAKTEHASTRKQDSRGIRVFVA